MDTTNIKQSLVTEPVFEQFTTENDRAAQYLSLPANYALADESSDLSRDEVATQLDEIPSAEARINRAAQWLLNGQIAQAHHAYQHVATQHPRYEGVCFNQLGAIACLRQQYDTALTYFRQAWLCGENQQVLARNIQYTKRVMRGEKTTTP